jgi:hypothetical protein
MSGPAMAGPTKRATLKQSELHATAAGRSDRGTRAGIRLCRAGCEKLAAIPPANSSTSNNPMPSCPAASSSATVPACAAVAAWDSMVRRTRSTRSATAPAIGLNSTAGARSQNATMPTQKALRVMSHASHATAMRWTHSPVHAVADAPKNRRALRWDSARARAPVPPKGKAAAPRRQRRGAGPVPWSTHSAARRSRSKTRPRRSVSMRRA